MEWTPARIRQFRETALCRSQDDFAAALGFAKRTVGNAERGTHPPSLALRRALDQALAEASDIQRDRFHTTLGNRAGTGPVDDSAHIGLVPVGCRVPTQPGLLLRNWNELT